jgi:hypothetical protein
MNRDQKQSPPSQPTSRLLLHLLPIPISINNPITITTDSTISISIPIPISININIPTILRLTIQPRITLTPAPPFNRIHHILQRQQIPLNKFRPILHIPNLLQPIPRLIRKPKPLLILPRQPLRILC